VGSDLWTIKLELRAAARSGLSGVEKMLVVINVGKSDVKERARGGAVSSFCSGGYERVSE
jgi:hypothetical protein